MSDLPAMELVGHHLICDAPACGHVEEVSEISASMIGKPCPKCGASLLTERDFIDGKAMLAGLEAIAAVLPKHDATKPAEYVRMCVSQHNGGLTITTSPDDEVLP